MPLVSVIIPNYNHEAFLERRIQSVLNQTFQDFEIILLDDCSIDGSRAIIERYRHHPKVKRIVYNDVNSGSPYMQWKKGIDLVETEWVWIAESDDSSSSNLLESFIPAYEEKDCLMAFAEVIFINEGGIPFGSINHFDPKWWNGISLVKEKLLLNNSICNAGMVLFRKKAALACGTHFTEFKLAGDWWLWCQIASMGKVYASGQPSAFFTRHAEELSIKYLDTSVEFEEHDYILEDLLAMGIIYKKDLQRVIYRKMIMLQCVRKGMKNDEYLRQAARWKRLAKEYRLKISMLKVHFGSKCENLKFALRKRHA